MQALLNREVFRTSRELEYFTEKELTLQTGHEIERWPEVVLKELVDNSLDACEAAGTLPEIIVSLESTSITVADNGPGIPADVIESVLDYSVRASSKDAYISPTRGAQGNALKTLLAIPYVVSDCRDGRIEVATRGVNHVIDVRIDLIAQEPAIAHAASESAFVKNGTLLKVHWPDCACLETEEVAPVFLQLLSEYALFNPHATLIFRVDGQEERFERTASECGKWIASEPTSSHWYSVEQLRALIAAYINAERQGAHARTVREFISEFRGLSSTAKQKAILSHTGLSNIYLHDLVRGNDVDREAIAALLAAMKVESKPVKPEALGLIKEDGFRAWFERRGAEQNTFRYKCIKGVDEDTALPFVVELAYAARRGGGERELLTGINCSPTLVNPFRLLSDYGIGLDGLLSQLFVYRDDPVTFALHLACPHLNYTDRGKSSLEVL